MTTLSKQYVRYFAPWKVQEYLVVAGDRSSWVRFTPAQLAVATAAAWAATVFPFTTTIAVEASSKSSVVFSTKVTFLKKGSDMLLGTCDVLSCGTTIFDNGTNAPIYGEKTTSSYTELMNNVEVHNGSNVFVRLLPADYPSSSSCPRFNA